MLGIALVGTTFYTLVNSHFVGLIISRTLGPYSDALAERGFSDPDPDIWRRMAARHRVMILIEPVEGEPFAFDDEGETLSPASPELTGNEIRAVRTAADGSRATLYWNLWSFRESHIPLLAGLIIMVGAVVGSGFWFLQRQLKPLAGLRAGVEALARGDLAVRVPIVRGDEIGQVAAAFNVMAGRVGEMIADRDRLLADVSHELRSPIARMKVALELMPGGSKRDHLSRDLNEMERLITALLEREALRSGGGRVDGERVDLAAIAGEVVDSFAARAPGVRIVPGEPAIVEADPALIRLLLRNLIDNAVKFSRADSQPIEVSLSPGDDEVTLRVADDGIGIPEGNEERLFEPFVKLDRARGHHAGYGLGLDLCRRIVQLHGGAIRLKPRHPRGTEAVVTLGRRRSASR